ncbi:hypothetical protein [Actibacterium ureilyticum]|uniref:hypothetical protein n=1 Tax=Actibacterium ureilyticum TaxID=1590614 RepID=UPI000BAAAC26|nr:hypothetical protein [Actibacterium ureilyticum]
MKTTILSLAAVTLMSGAALAAGSDSTTPPKPTETTTVCQDGQIFDAATKTCLDSKADLFDDTNRYEAAREMAYAGQYTEALTVLASAENASDPRILNYKGFVNRKLGHSDLAMAYYTAALKVDPDYILARSYMGQGLVAEGDFVGARNQLIEIRARGGEGSWAEASLEQALMGQVSDW